ncbi:hypothetical protein A3731_40860 [Roseovarius sp. HI0049]|nr:hypothetical protein A3731_40860 [Roseovarius sp. HI0049]
MFNGVPIIEVEPGTVIELDGAELTVTDEQYVCKNGTFYVTPNTFAALWNHPGVKSVQKE